MNKSDTVNPPYSIKVAGKIANVFLWSSKYNFRTVDIVLKRIIIMQQVVPRFIIRKL